MNIFVAYSWISCFLALQTLADDAPKPATDEFSASRRVMFVESQTEVFDGKKSTGTVPPGSVFRFTTSKDGWLFLPDKDAWVQQQRVIPIEQANAYFTNLINAKPTMEAFHHRGIARQAMGYDQLALEDFDEAARMGLSSPSLHINRAAALHKVGERRRAMEEVDQAIRIDPENPLAYNRRCQIWASMGDLKRALADATRAIRIDPDYAEGFNSRGVTKVKQGNYASAIDDYDQAVRLQPAYVEAFANRGFAHKKLADYRAALEDYRQAVTLAPRQPQAFNDAAWLIATCPEETYRDGRRAVEYARHACELTEFQNGDYVDTLAAAYAEAGQFDEAAKAQQQALTLLPESAHESARRRLRLYQNQQPFREDP